MAPKSRITRRIPCVNLPANIPGEQDELADAPERSNAGSDEASTFFETPTPPLVPSPSEDFFTKFMKVFMEKTQAQAQALAEPKKRPFKTRTSKTYWGKSHMEYYHFCQQCEDYFKTLGVTKINRTPFATSFFCGSIRLWWAQHKRHHKSATFIT